MQSSLRPNHTVERCIYCGAYAKLTDEHIFPLGLGGNFIFPKSSCTSCNAMTSKFELKVLRGHMTAARAVAGLPTRRKKSRHRTVSTQFIRSDGSSTREEVPLAQASAQMFLPLLAPAAMIYGLEPVVGVQISGIDTINVGQKLYQVIAEHAAVGIKGTLRLEHFTFCQLLCKIEYSYQIAMHGEFDRSESPALAILKGEELNASNWVGKSIMPLSEFPTSSLHLITSDSRASTFRQTIQVTTIQLFSNVSQSAYEVVVHAKDWQSWYSHTDA